MLQHEGRRNVEQAEIEREEAAEIYGEEAEEEVEAEKARGRCARKPKDWELIGRVPTARTRPGPAPTPRKRKLVWVTAEGAGSARTPCSRARPSRATRARRPAVRPRRSAFKYLPSYTFGRRASCVPHRRAAREADPARVTPDPPENAQKPPEEHADRRRAGGKFKHVFYIVRENRTYDQIFGDDPRGDGDPKLSSSARRSRPTPTRSPSASRCSTTSTPTPRRRSTGTSGPRPAAVSDYVVKSWHQNYAGRKRPYDFGVYSVTWPSAGFLFDQAAKQGISYFNYGEAVAGTVRSTDDDRTPEETAAGRREVREVRPRTAGSGPPRRGHRRRLLLERRLLGRTRT